MVREPNPMSRLMKLAAPYRGKFILSVILAVFGVAAGLLPFFAVSRIVVLLMEKETSVSVYMEWCLVAGFGFLAKVCLSNLSTLISHTATFVTLAEIRHNMLQQIILYGTSVLVIAEGLCFYLNGTMKLSVCLLMTVASFMLFGGLSSAGNTSALLRLLDVSIDKVEEIDKTPVMDEHGKSIKPQNYDIVFDDVSFSYEEQKILDHVSLTIPEKTTTAIVGPSGAGKSTLCNLIARFFDVDGGKITIGGTDIRDYTLDSLLAGISEVFQKVYLLIRQPGIYADFIGVRRKAIGWKLKQT